MGTSRGKGLNSGMGAQKSAEQWDGVMAWWVGNIVAK